MLCVFDVNETLLDLAALDDFFASLTGSPAARQEWFDLVIHNALTLTAAQVYRPFGQIAADCLPAVADRHGRGATRDHQFELGRLLRQLPAHPDVPAGVRLLRAAGFRVVTLTNSTAEVAQDQVANAGLRDLIDAVYSADEAGALKPAPAAYSHVLGREQVQPADAVLVAAHDWDVAGAAAAGLRTAFVSRDGRIPLSAHTAPDVSGTTLEAIADQLVARHSG